MYVPTLYDTNRTDTKEGERYTNNANIVFPQRSTKNTKSYSFIQFLFFHFAREEKKMKMKVTKKRGRHSKRLRKDTEGISLNKVM